MQTRRLGLVDSFSLVVGTIIGTGVFLKAAIMSQTVGSPLYVLLAWVAAGLLALAGALTYAELGMLFPQAGGEYVYLRKAYGDLPAFLYGWQRFWAAAPGSIAAYAVGSATFAAPLIDMSVFGGPKVFAVSLIAVFTLLNCAGVVLGGRVQTFLTALKVFLIFFVIGGIFFFAQSAGVHNFSAPAESTGWPGLSAFGAAILAATWAYGGWDNLPMVAGEIKNPKRNIPLSLGLGVLAIVFIYVLVHVAYFYALPFGEVISANSKYNPDALPVATKAAQTFLGAVGYPILAGGFFLSAIGAMNGSVLTNSRVPYALAQDGLFFKPLAKLHPTRQTPVVSLLVQGVLAIILALSGTFDQLTDYVVFASWIFFTATTSSVFVFRKRYPELERTYKTFGYPYVPALFILTTISLLVNTLLNSPRESAVGLGIIIAGVPAYWLMKKR
jgi:basic amino acid/polyamine antiporter, APA family